MKKKKGSGGEKKRHSIKMSFKEELYNTSCEGEDAEMAMLTKRYKKLTFQRDQRMGISRRNFRRDQFRNEPLRNNQITCYGCK